MRPYTKIPNQMLNQSQLSIPARYLYCVLLRHCGKNDKCFPSQKTLGKEVGITDRYIRKMLIELINAGLVYKRRLGYNRANTYTVSKDLKTDWNQGSYRIGSIFPLHQGNTVPDKSTYIKGKGKRSIKGLEKMRDALIEKHIIK
jgi:hypothetical protein